MKIKIERKPETTCTTSVIEYQGDRVVYKRVVEEVIDFKTIITIKLFKWSKTWIFGGKRNEKDISDNQRETSKEDQRQ
jgi:hypothetical protein